MIVKKENYGSEYVDLAREQYKDKPLFSRVMASLGVQAQEIEDAAASATALNTILTAAADSPRDALERAAVMFGIAKPQSITKENLAREIKASLVIIFGRCRREDIFLICKTLYNFTADIQELPGGMYISIFEAMTRAQGKNLYRYLRRLMPAGITLYGIIQGGSGFFGFSSFTDSGGWRLSSAASDPNHRMARVAVDSGGHWLLGP